MRRDNEKQTVVQGLEVKLKSMNDAFENKQAELHKALLQHSEATACHSLDKAAVVADLESSRQSAHTLQLQLQLAQDEAHSAREETLQMRNELSHTEGDWHSMYMPLCVNYHSLHMHWCLPSFASLCTKSFCPLPIFLSLPA